MNKFDLITFKESKVPKGIWAKIDFPNGWSASIVKNDVSYGGKMGLFEIAVLDKKGDISSKTDITDDVLGWLDERKVEKTLDAIRLLDESGKLPEGVTL